METNITKQRAIEALREYRIAVRLINGLMTEALDRWSRQEPQETIAYSEAEISRYQEARVHLQNSMWLNPFFPACHALLANAYGEIDGDVKLQFQYYNSALELDPDDDDVLVARMKMHMDAARIDDAERDLAHLGSLESSHAPPMADHLERLRNGGESGKGGHR